MKHLDPPEVVREFLESINLPGSSTNQVLAGLTALVDLLIKHGARKKLLSASQRNSESIWFHIFDSLQPLAIPTVRESMVFVDGGSGGGLPGIPLALARPNARVLLVEQSVLKAEFLELAKVLIPSPNVEVHCCELKAIARETDSNSVIMARALIQPENWPVLVRKMKLRNRWIIFATQSNKEAWESAASQCDMTAKASHEYSLPGSDLLRTLLELTPL